MERKKLQIIEKEKEKLEREKLEKEKKEKEKLDNKKKIILQNLL